MRTLGLPHRYGTKAVLAATLTVFCMSLFLGAGKVASAGMSNQEIALSMATLLRSARAVVSDGQSLINDETKGAKGFTSDVVIAAAKQGYKLKTGVDIDSIDPSTLHGELIQAELEAIAEVVDAVQARINRPGVRFKGFLPAIFAVDVTKRFKAKKGQIAEIKLTAPKNYVRNRANLPDSWEHAIIERQFRSANHPLGQFVDGMVTANGRKAYRLILPEYYKTSCLVCHGEPKGKRDITGGKKEGGVLGGLGGAISVVIYKTS